MGIKSNYNVISIGTEKSGSNGYMSVSEGKNGVRIISPISHSEIEIDESNEDNLFVSDMLSIECICMLRFQLISALSLKDIKDKTVCVYGCGAIGIGAYLECVRQQAKTVTLVTRRKDAVNYFNMWINIEKFDGIKDYDIYIDCTGDENYIYPIINGGAVGSIFYEIGTPRSAPSIDLLLVHRKNMSIIGGHELNGIPKARRKEQCKKLSDYYFENRMFLEKIGQIFVRKHNDIEYALGDIYEHKFIEPINVIVREK